MIMTTLLATSEQKKDKCWLALSGIEGTTELHRNAKHGHRRGQSPLTIVPEMETMAAKESVSESLNIF